MEERSTKLGEDDEEIKKQKIQVMLDMDLS